MVDGKSADAGASRVIGIDAARGGAVLLVVFMHVCGPVHSQLPPLIRLLNHAIGGARMPLLLFLSGYLAQSLLTDRRRAISRGADLAWLYAIWTGIGWLTNGWNFLALLIVPSSPLWYIWGLAFAAVTLPIACRVPAAVVIAASAIVAMASYAHLVPVEADTNDRLLRQLVFFYIGLYGGKSIVLALSSWSPVAFTIGIAILGVMRLVNWTTTTAFSIPLLALPERAVIIALVLNVCLLMPALFLKPFAWFGRRSLQIYVGHIMLLDTLRNAASDMTWASHVTIVMVAATAISLAAHRVAQITGMRFLYRRPRMGFNEFLATMRKPLASLWKGAAGPIAALAQRN